MLEALGKTKENMGGGIQKRPFMYYSIKNGSQIEWNYKIAMQLIVSCSLFVSELLVSKRAVSQPKFLIHN
jgi:hypothetical protein